MFHSQPHRSLKEQRESACVCEEKVYVLFLTRYVANNTGTMSWPLRLCVTDFVLSCPFLETLTQTQTLKLSFLIEALHSLPCKHPARAAGVHTIQPPLRNLLQKSPQQLQTQTRTLVLMLRVVCTLQALRNRTAPRQRRRTCWQHWGPGRMHWRKH